MPKLIVFVLFLFPTAIWGQCPWSRDSQLIELQSSCVCNTSQNQGFNAISIQCQAVNYPMLMSALRSYTSDTILENLYISNTTIGSLTDFLFKNLKIISLHMNNCNVIAVSDNAFRGLENTLQSLSLASNGLRSVPVVALRQLRLLSQLDLSSNYIKFVPDNAFVTLRLKTLKMAENNLTVSDNALRGLETSLKNLNLKGCQLKSIPLAVRDLQGLAFLDLAQNNLRTIEPGSLQRLNALTALNLERNVIQKLHRDVFLGVNDTLSSLSMLNNLLTEFPVEAIRSLPELRVLDLGFNLIRVIPTTAFKETKDLTLLALDGNPMAFIPEEAISHLNKSLRGLSLGGRFLTCDCKMRWITEWIQNFDLQVTSRERNPQFCGNPQHLRDRNFYQLNARDLTCGQPKTTTPKPTTTARTTTTTTARTTTTPKPLPPLRVSRPPPRRRMGLGTIARNNKLEPGDIVTEIKMNVGQNSNSRSPLSSLASGNSRSSLPSLARVPQPIDVSTAPLAGMPRGPPIVSNIVTRRPNPVTDNEIVAKPRAVPTASLTVQDQQEPRPRPSNIVMRPDTSSLQSDALVGNLIPDEVIVRDAYKEDNSIVIKWDTDTSNILGFRIVYRLFGKPEFKQGPPLAPSEREFRIKNVPSNECIVVCVVSLEEVNITPGNIPYQYCREIRTEGIGASKQLDYIIIPASAAIVATVIIAVIIFIACLKTSQKKRKGKILDEKPIHTLSMSGMAHTLPGPPLAGLASLGLGPPTQKDWDQMSMYSQRSQNHSVNRARMYHHMDRAGSIGGGFIPEDARSHISHLSSKSRVPSLADLTGKNQGPYPGLGAGLGFSRPDLRQSRQSLVSHGQFDGRQSRASKRSIHRQPSRSRSRDRLNTGGPGYMGNVDPRDQNDPRDPRDPRDDDSLGEDSDENWAGTSTDNNWTDYDQEIYMHRNPTHKFNTRPGFGRDDVNL